MACYYTDDCGEYTVSPVLVTPCYPTKYCEEPPMCCPYLPRCPKGLVYCCEKRAPKNPRPTPVYCEHDVCYENHHHCHHSPVRCRVARSPPPPTRKTSGTGHCPTCCQPICKPVKTKYVMPCYRYEDGRIINQPTVLMRRACEVAVGTRLRKKPFVVSSFSADQCGEVRRYHSEDERGNCCYHFERKKRCSDSNPHPHQTCNPHPCTACSPCPPSPCAPSRPQLCTSSPECQYVDCIHAKAVKPPKSCCSYHV